MRRRPLEFWWIALYCVVRAILLFSDSRAIHLSFDRAIFSLLGSSFLFAPILMLMLLPSGRLLSSALLGFEMLAQSERLAEKFELTGGLEIQALLNIGFCLWMSVFLQRPSTAQLFRPLLESANSNSPVLSNTLKSGGFVRGWIYEYASRIGFLNSYNLPPALLTAWAAFGLGAPIWLWSALALSAYALTCMFFEDWMRQRWALYFSPPEMGFPVDEMRTWRAARLALMRNRLDEADEHFCCLNAAARAHPAGKIFELTLNWQRLVSAPPASGREIFERALLDHDFIPSDGERRRLMDFVRESSEAQLRIVTNARAEFVAAMAHAITEPSSFMHARADSILARITGETFAFNASGHWAQWWHERRSDWTGDAGPVAAVARLLMRDCYSAALELARKTAARAEEPLLVELASQMFFFVSIRESGKTSDISRECLNAPLNVLLVPEWSDALGWLHADSPVLSNLGITRKTVSRRLLMRVRLLDYAAKFWSRYAPDLSADLPWLLPLLSGKNFGVLQARSRFDAWWPKAREAQLRYGKAIVAGLDCLEKNEVSAAEKLFGQILQDRPNDLSARYNLAICRMRCDDHEQAEILLRELTALEPKEPYWWMALGDLHRAANAAIPARVAYTKAQELGAAEGRVALHLGLTFAYEDRHGEAIKHLDIALGKNPTPSKLEALAMTLENEGFWKLAGHYREEALRRELEGFSSDDGRGGRGDETLA